MAWSGSLVVLLCAVSWCASSEVGEATDAQLASASVSGDAANRVTVMVHSDGRVNGGKQELQQADQSRPKHFIRREHEHAEDDVQRARVPRASLEQKKYHSGVHARDQILATATLAPDAVMDGPCNRSYSVGADCGLDATGNQKHADVDHKPQCLLWWALSECEKNQVFMLARCNHSCEECGTGGEKDTACQQAQDQVALNVQQQNQQHAQTCLNSRATELGTLQAAGGMLWCGWVPDNLQATAVPEATCPTCFGEFDHYNTCLMRCEACPSCVGFKFNGTLDGEGGCVLQASFGSAALPHPVERDNETLPQDSGNWASYVNHRHFTPSGTLAAGTAHCGVATTGAAAGAASGAGAASNR